MDSLAVADAVDVGASLRDTIAVLQAKAHHKGATVSLDVAPDLPAVRAAGAELNQVWFHLLDNALDAVERSGHVAVAARLEGDRIVVRFVDDGKGIAAAVLSQIFDPFFTTKPPGQGLGLGLDTAQRLVRRHHGEIEVESRPGRTEFRVSLRKEPQPQR
jgi:signal transduction histidine kinase